jgi:hypothetical protein
MRSGFRTGFADGRNSQNYLKLPVDGAFFGVSRLRNLV